MMKVEAVVLKLMRAGDALRKQGIKFAWPNK